MKVLVVIAHPNNSSFNHGISKAVIEKLKGKGHDVIFHDLYDEAFDPVLPGEEIPTDSQPSPEIKKYCDEIVSSGGIVVIHPNWWGQPPAILKGWIDRIFRFGIAYEFKEVDGAEGVPAGLLNDKTALVINTSNTPMGHEIKEYGDPLETLWRKCIFNFCGVKTFHRKMFASVVMSTADERKKWLEEVEDLVDKYF